jgi:hypothetical protein
MGWKYAEQAFGSVGRVLDDDFRLEQIEVNDVAVVDYSYDADGLIRYAGDLEIQRDDDNGVVTGTILDE